MREQFSEIIPAGLAKRNEGFVSDYSVKKLSTRQGGPDPIGTRKIIETWVKFRILDFEVVR